MRLVERSRALTAIGATVLTAAVVCAVGASATGVGASTLRTVGAALSHPMGAHKVAPGPAGGGGVSGTSGTSGIVISIGSQGVVVNKGLTVDVPITVACGTPSNGGIQVTEGSGHTISQGFGNLSGLQCDGNSHTFVATAQAENVRFRPGTAVVNVSIFSCGFFFCSEADASATVRLVHG